MEVAKSSISIILKLIFINGTAATALILHIPKTNKRKNQSLLIQWDSENNTKMKIFILQPLVLTVRGIRSLEAIKSKILNQI